MPRTVLATMAILLLFVSSASAECAWVLWLKGEGGPHVVAYQDWSPSKAFQSHKECEDVVRFWGGIGTYDTRGLPDTVDPRGPKGGGR